jgi:hypothetical protein
VTNVMMRKSRIAQRIRLTRYRNIRSLPPVLVPPRNPTTE